MRALDLNGDWVWLLDLTWPGALTTRLSNRPVSVVAPDGTSWLYQGGIPALRFTLEAPFASMAVGGRTLNLSGVPLEQDLVRRLNPTGSSVALSYWKVGTPWKARVPVFVGRVSACTWGADGQGCNLELSEQPFEDRGVLIGDKWTITDTDWSNAPEASLGAVMPLVIGSPGVYRDGGAKRTAAGSPAILVDETTPTLLIAGHVVAATSVTIYTPDAGDGFREEVKAVSRVFKAGRWVSVVVLTPESAPAAADSDFGITTPGGDVQLEDLIAWTYYVIWDQGGGGIKGEDGTALTRVGEVIEWMVRKSSLLGDWSRLRLARRWLDQLKIDTYADIAGMRPWEFLRQVVLPLFPVSMISGPSGVYPVVWRLHAERHNRLARLVEGINCWRVSKAEPADLTPVSEVQVSFAQSDESGDALAQLVWSGDPHRTIGQDGVSTCARSRQAWLRHGDAGVAPVDAGAVWDRFTATRIAAWQIAAGWAPYDVVEFNVEAHLAGLEPGDFITITDVDLDYDERRAWVQAVTWASTYVRVALLVEPRGV